MRVATKQYEYNGESHTLNEWAEIKGISRKTLYSRLERMPFERAITMTVNKSMNSAGKGKRRIKEAKKYEANGEWHTLKEWAEIKGISEQLIRNRISKGKTPEQAITEPLAWSREAKTKYDYHGKLMTAEELAEMSGFSVEVIKGRIRNGWPIDKAVTKPIRKPPHDKPIYEDFNVIKKCNRYDCLSQDGSGICQLGYKNQTECGENYVDAYEYYYGGSERRKKRRMRNGLHYFGSGSAYIYQNHKEEKKTDRWAKDRQLLCCGYVSN